MSFQLVTYLKAGLEKASDATGTLPAVLLAVAFLLFFGIGNALTGGHLDPQFQFSNWIMNGIGFCMFFILAYIAKTGKDHAKAAHHHAKSAHEKVTAVHEKLHADG